MQTLVTGKIYFSPKPLEETNPNSLVVGQLLEINKSEQRLNVVNILGMPLNVPPGDYTLILEIRPKKGKPGINYWYKGHQAPQK